MNLREMFVTMTPEEIRKASFEREIEGWKAGELRPDGDEVLESAWFRRGALPEIPRKGSIARMMLDAWSEGRI